MIIMSSLVKHFRYTSYTSNKELLIIKDLAKDLGCSVPKIKKHNET